MNNPQLAAITRMVDQHADEDPATSAGLAWARTLALGRLVLDMVTGDRDDAGVRTLSTQLELAAVVTLCSGGDLETAALHHDHLADELESVRPGEDPRSALGSAVAAHRFAAQICRGDLDQLRFFATHQRDGTNFSAALRLPTPH
ncbi:hypothetical protein GCM10025867_07870 [Frondihabitans sucicola]|uniref:DUF222 domain-containing protein n=1 Tax=Frondihabitans sucicola TaxID=1268041 RepID=A0ABM8GJJ4_9MICO|nr:hypothetical protein [Frondihabitans sucicola]BDZ48546.1 hypothetical protein GCM10025867_07870 [Frondihabitans sucicola]